MPEETIHCGENAATN